MRFLLYILPFLLFLSPITYSQKKQVTSIPDHCEDCFFKNKYKIEERRRFFPFSKAKKILLISFEALGEEDPPIIDINGKVVKQPDVDSERPSVDTFGYKRVFEIVILNEKEEDNLTNILYNNFYVCNGGMVTHACYSPRNAIIFIGAKGEMIGYFEICFECLNYKTLPATIKTGDLCREKYEMLRNFFSINGIKYGTSTPR